jgi:peroxiredoxin
LNCSKRATVIVDKSGKVAYAKVQDIKVAREDKDILAALAKLS